MRGASRWVFLIHRYAGLVLALLMLMWCLSGIVMMYVPFPALAQSERLAGLRPLDWRQCCTLPVGGRLDRFSVERTQDHLRMFGGSLPLDLGSGQRVTSVTPDDARRAALDFAHGNGLGTPSVTLDTIDHDQWTVNGFRRDKPLYRVRLNDRAGTTLYVSSVSSKIVQRTNRAQRFWNYLGAVPHWLYFTRLRAHPTLWAQIMIWTSIAGILLVLTGLYAGIRQWLRARRAQRWSPYRGFTWWHHVPGLVFGTFLLTWTVSGLLSMNPWGFLESPGPQDAVAALSGGPISVADIGNALGAISVARRTEAVKILTAAPLGGRLYLVATLADGARQRWDGAGHDAPVMPADLAFITERLAPGTTPVLLPAGDDYYFGIDGEKPTLPVWRLITANGDRYYVDAVSGSLAGGFDSAARGSRWWFQGLHRLDFVAALRVRPLWDIVVLVLLLGATLIAATGGWMALKFAFRARRAGLR